MSLDPAKRIALKDIKVVGIGCANSCNTVALVEAVAKEKTSKSRWSRSKIWLPSSAAA